MDPVNYKAPKKFTSKLDIEHSALLVIDMQNDFVSSDGYVARKGADVSSVIATVPKIRALLNTFRSMGATVIFTKTVHYDFTDTRVWLSRSAEKIVDSGICGNSTYWIYLLDNCNTGNDIIQCHV
ncbi:MAG: cysteine hydrolase family protein [Thermoplasmataceae archaeon]